ncbi:MAG: hypothetical protein JOZ92_05825, partial [Candidatus Dormibacteraeota bacterium]|nr:hypothetical protein [Candidatus Dormibacteraeota bacterium]
MRRVRLTPRLLVVAAAFAMTGCSAAASGRTASLPVSPGSTASASATPLVGCLNQAQALAVWNAVNQKLDAIELDPKHQGAGQIATGDALALITNYLQQ